MLPEAAVVEKQFFSYCRFTPVPRDADLRPGSQGDLLESHLFTPPLSRDHLCKHLLLPLGSLLSLDDSWFLPQEDYHWAHPLEYQTCLDVSQALGVNHLLSSHASVWY